MTEREQFEAWLQSGEQRGLTLPVVEWMWEAWQAARAAAPADHPLTPTRVVDHEAPKVSDKPVAWALVSRTDHVHKLAIKRDSIERKAERTVSPHVIVPLFASPIHTDAWRAEAMRFFDQSHEGTMSVDHARTALEQWLKS